MRQMMRPLLTGLVAALLLATGLGAQDYYRGATSGAATSVSAAAFPLLAPNGTVGAPSYSFSGSPTAGLFSSSAGILDFATGGVDQFRVQNNIFVLPSTGNTCWASGVIGNPADVCMSRVSADVLGIGNAAPTDGALALKTVTMTATLFAALGTPANGTMVFCSDCLPASSPCTGASTGTFAYRQNAAWKCF